MAIGTGAALGCVGVARNKSTRPGKCSKGDRIGLDGCGARPGTVEVVKGTQSQVIVTFRACDGCTQGAVRVRGVERCHVRIGTACGRIGMARRATVLGGHRAGQVAVLASRTTGSGCRNLMASQAVVGVVASCCIVIGIGHSVRGNTGATGMAGSGLAESVGKG